MKLTPDCTEVLKNFSTINQSILLTPKKVLGTVAESKNVLAQAKIGEKFDKEFGIYNLNEFLATLGLFNDPSFELTDTHLSIKDDVKGSRSSCKYYFADTSMIPEMPSTEKIEKVIKGAEIKFDLSEEDFALILKATGTFQSKNIIVESDGKKINLTATDIENSSANSYSIVVGEGIGKKFKMIFKTQNLSVLLKGSYQVKISKLKISEFKNTSKDLVYWIALEDSSTYSE
jgi:hypothetical protein